MIVSWSIKKFSIDPELKQKIATVIHEQFGKQDFDTCFINEIANCFSPFNMTFYATLKKKSAEIKYVLRISQAHLAEIAREHLATLHYSQLGATPRSIYTKYIAPNLGIIIMEFVDNKAERFELSSIDKILINKLAHLLRKVHLPVSQLTEIQKTIYSHNPVYDFVIKRSKQLIRDHRHLNWLNRALYYINFLQKVTKPYSQSVLTHNDLHPANMLFDRNTKQLYAIDWESLSIGDPLFDLATVAVFLRLNQKQEFQLLTGYYSCLQLTHEQEAHYFLVKQWVYLYYALGPIICNTPKKHLPTNIITALQYFNNYKSSLSEVHPANLSPEECLKVSAMLAKTAFSAINSPEYTKALTVIASLNAAQYRWAHYLQRVASFFPSTLLVGIFKLFDAVTDVIETTIFMQDLLKIKPFPLLLSNVLVKFFAQVYPINCSQEFYIQVLLHKELFPLLEIKLAAMHRNTSQYPTLSGPFFIVLEGGRASGKTTQILYLKRYFERCVNELRKIVIEKANNDAIKPLFMALLSKLGISDPTSYDSRLPNTFFFQGLLTMQTRRIIAALQQGKIVIADRWKDSYYVHNIMQTPFKDIKPNLSSELDKLVFRNLTPNLKILLDVNTKTAEKRIGKRNRLDKNLASTASFLEDSRQKFLHRFKSGGYIINTDEKPPDEIFATILNIVKFHYDLLLMSRSMMEQHRPSVMRTPQTLFQPPRELPPTFHTPPPTASTLTNSK